VTTWWPPHRPTAADNSSASAFDREDGDSTVAVDRGDEPGVPVGHGQVGGVRRVVIRSPAPILSTAAVVTAPVSSPVLMARRRAA
jgi:hypothetical protein